jgi:ABC-type antimicrobial peptide transport system permease subunit
MDVQRKIDPKKKQRRRAVLAIAGTIAVFLVTLGVSRLKPAVPGVLRNSVLISEVKRGSILRQVRGTGTLVPASGEPLNYVKGVREAVYSIDPEQPISDIKTLDQLRSDSLAATRLTAILLALFAVVAMVIAATGLSGVISFLVSQRTREIGIRMALGARGRDVLLMVLGQGLKLIAIGLAVGIAAAAAGSRVIRALLFDTPGD